MSEERDDEKLQAAGAEVVTTLYSITRAVTLYDANNAAVVRLIDMLTASVGAALGTGSPEFKVQLLADEVFVNGRLLKVDPVLYERATALVERLTPYEVGEITFSKGVDRKTIETFVGDLAASARSGKTALRREGYGTLAIGKARGASIASFRFEPDRLAVWLYTSLLDVTERLYAEHAGGKSPSLLPVKRTLQLVIDNMRTHGAIYQLLGTVQHPGKAPCAAQVRAVTAVNLVGFGIFLGLGNAELMNLALAGILGGLAPTTDPDEAVRVLLRFPGLGDNAMPLTLILHDARSARRMEEGGLPGAIVAMVEEYVRGISATERRPAVAPARVVKALVDGRIEWVPAQAALAFAAWKGPYPLGSVVEMKPSGMAVVVGQPEHPLGKQRPIVAMLQGDGSLGPRIDLVARRDLEIAAVADPAKAGTRLRIHAARA